MNTWLFPTFLLFVLPFSFMQAQSDTWTEEEIAERNERIRQRWNRSLVRDSTYRFNREANGLLAETIKDLDSGKSLSIAMGQGRNALYLARNGWEAHGFDLADEAIAFAEQQAEEEGLEIHTEVISMEDFDYGIDRYDLVTMLYAGCIWDESLPGKIKESLKPGGLFIFEFFHREAGIEMDRPTFGCEANAIKDKIEGAGGFDILLYEEKRDVADYGLDERKLIFMVASRTD